MAHGGCQLCQGPPARRGSQRGERWNRAHKRGRNTKIHLAVDSHGLPVRIAVTSGTVADCTQALPLVKGLKAAAFMADCGYDTDAIVEVIGKEGMQVVIPPRAHRKVQRPYDEDLHKLRHLAGNAFLAMKEWRGLATRYAKRLSSYRAIVQIRCIFMWLKVIS